MGNKSLADRSPFRRKGSASAKIYMVLAKSPKPLPAEAIAKLAKVPEKQARTLLAAYMNPFHNAPLRRAGLAITSVDGTFKLVNAKATPNAKRPTRGSASQKAKKGPKSRKRLSKKPSKKAKRKIKSGKASRVYPPPAMPPSVENGSISTSDGPQGNPSV